MKSLPFLMLAVAFLAGCGGEGGDTSGGGGTPLDRFARPKVSIAWGPRSREVSGPSSALSAVVLLQNASRTGDDVTYTVDRTGPAEGSTVAYTGPQDVKVALTALTVRFYSQPGGTGAMVGMAYGVVPLAADGTVSPWVTNAGVVQSVEVPDRQVVDVGTPRPLTFSVRDAGGTLVAVTPGSATWSVVSGSDKLAIAGDLATGSALGTAQVAATVDGKTSSPRTVLVETLDAISVGVAPASRTLVASSSQQFTASVRNTNDPAVEWSVVEAGGGTIAASGLYTAPSVPGTYTVRATSVMNPAKTSSATVTVFGKRSLKELLEIDANHSVQLSAITLVRGNVVTVLPGGGSVFLRQGEPALSFNVDFPAPNPAIVPGTTERIRIQIDSEIFEEILNVASFEPNADGIMLGGLLSPAE